MLLPIKQHLQRTNLIFGSASHLKNGKQFVPGDRTYNAICRDAVCRLVRTHILVRRVVICARYIQRILRCEPLLELSYNIIAIAQLTESSRISVLVDKHFRFKRFFKCERLPSLFSANTICIQLSGLLVGFQNGFRPCSEKPVRGSNGIVLVVEERLHFARASLGAGAFFQHWEKHFPCTGANDPIRRKAVCCLERLDSAFQSIVKKIVDGKAAVRCPDSSPDHFDLVSTVSFSINRTVVASGMLYNLCCRRTDIRIARQRAVGECIIYNRELFYITFFQIQVKPIEHSPGIPSRITRKLSDNNAIHFSFCFNYSVFSYIYAYVLNSRASPFKYDNSWNFRHNTHVC